MLASWQELDQIDAALQQHHASLRPHATAAQAQALLTKFIKDATN
jgi:hypothetical protein